MSGDHHKDGSSIGGGEMKDNNENSKLPNPSLTTQVTSSNIGSSISLKLANPEGVHVDDDELINWFEQISPDNQEILLNDFAKRLKSNASWVEQELVRDTAFAARLKFQSAELWEKAAGLEEKVSLPTWRFQKMYNNMCPISQEFVRSKVYYEYQKEDQANNINCLEGKGKGFPETEEAVAEPKVEAFIDLDLFHHQLSLTTPEDETDRGKGVKYGSALRLQEDDDDELKLERFKVKSLLTVRGGGSGDGGGGGGGGGQQVGGNGNADRQGE